MRAGRLVALAAGALATIVIVAGGCGEEDLTFPGSATPVATSTNAPTATPEPTP
jgi:hypothetical protein